MNNKKILSVIGLLGLMLTLLPTLAEEKEIPCPPGMDFSEYFLLSTEGGYYYLPKSGYGSVLFVNLQTRVPLAELQQVAQKINDENWVELRFASAPGKAEVVIEIVDKSGDPALSVFPDDKRASVNVAALTKDNPKPEILASRTRKELIRAFSFLAGISGGAGEGHIMDVMSDLKRLDAAKEEVPGELVIRNAVYLDRSGIKPYVRETYKDACEQGHAPQPTNIWQKAIWEKVHERPTKPMKIKYDPKTGK